MKLKKLLPFLFILVIFTSCSQKESVRTQTVLGTICTVNLFDDGTTELQNKIFSKLNQIDNDFSVNKSDSIVSKINQNAGIQKVEVTQEVYFVIQQAIYYAELSNGRFDPTVGPLVKLWNITGVNPKVPTSEELSHTLPLINYKNVQLSTKDDSYFVFLTKEGMELDLGGIAKGFACDKIVEILKESNVKRGIINLGGNVYVYGNKYDEKGKVVPWKVGIKNPKSPNGEVALLLDVSANRTIVTSGSYERYFEADGKRYHHILDCRTGFPVETSVASATIISENSLQADALSTISFILGPQEFQPIQEETKVEVHFLYQ